MWKKRGKLDRTNYLITCALNKKITVLEDLKPLLSELKRIGNNLNQLTWRVNEGTLTAINLEETKKEIAKIFELLNNKMKGK